MGGWVSIMSNAAHGTLYIGVTADLAARIVQHREGKGSIFCRKHGLTRLVYVEPHQRIKDAIAREKAMKKWKRTWKTKLIRQANPDWADLFELIKCLAFSARPDRPLPSQGRRVEAVGAIRAARSAPAS